MEKKRNRKILLRLVSLLSLFFFGSYALFLLVSSLFPSFVLDSLDSLPKLFYYFQQSLSADLEANRIYYGIASLIYIGISYGLILIYRGRWLGFIIFSTLELLILIIPIIFLGPRSIALGDIMLGGLLILFFFVELSKYKHKARKLRKETIDEENL